MYFCRVSRPPHPQKQKASRLPWPLLLAALMITPTTAPRKQATDVPPPRVPISGTGAEGVAPEHLLESPIRITTTSATSAMEADIRERITRERKERQNALDEGNEEHFEAHKRKVANSGVALKAPDGRGIFIPARCSSRYFPQGREKQKNRIKRRIRPGSEPGCLLTLTVDPSKYQSRADATAAIWRGWSVLRDFLNRRRARKGMRALGYFAVLEFTRDRWPHLHIWLPRIKYLAPRQLIAANWPCGRIIDIRYRNISAVGYILKYITKGVGSGSDVHSILYAARARQYSASQSLCVAVGAAPPSGFTFLGICRGSRIETIFNQLAANPTLATVEFYQDSEGEKIAEWVKLCYEPGI